MATRRTSSASRPAAQPAPWLESFRKILDLEAARKFEDRAVVGGLDSFVQRWAKEMAAFLDGAPQAPDLATASYERMSPEERSRWVDRWRAALDSPTAPDSVERISPQTVPSAAVAPPQEEDQAQAPTDASPVPAARPTTPRPAPSAPAPSAPTMKRRAPPPGLTVDAAVDRLRGVDTKLTARLKRLGVSTIRDLLYLFPRRHRDYSQTSRIAELEPGREWTISATIWEARQVSVGQQGRLKATEAVLSDDSGNVKATWFGQGYLARTLRPGARVAISGKVDVFKGQLVFENPEYELLSEGQASIHTGRLAPVYPLTEGLTGRNLRRLTRQAIEGWLGGIEDGLAPATLARTGLMPLAEAIQQAHYPDGWDAWQQARRRLAFDELLILQLAVLSQRRERRQGVEGVSIDPEPKTLQGFVASLPFPLTAAQKRCIREILEDMKPGSPPMNRLLQGEVGSGKTVVVLVALLAAAAAGYQGAIMVPTEVLAEQHFRTVSTLLSGLARPVLEDNLVTVYLESLGRPVSAGLLTGSTRQSVRRELMTLASRGNLDLLIGTHALIQSGVEVPRLALAVMDEQHRFGVMQRSALRYKGIENPHSLVMSATPIPRTLSLTLYGDLDLSTIDELPPGRQEVQTRWVEPSRRPAAYRFLAKQVEDGRQAFVICPLVDESEAIESRAATEEHRRLSEEVFPDLRLGLLHGRMSSKDKERVMRQFRDGELDILVSTAVVEVGIDVANATVMLIEGADRFGLSQLHQFRGRVGRGEHKSYCMLLSDATSETAKERLSALEQIHDGFKLAEVDLELRGPGDFFGTRQSGLPDLRMAQFSDRDLLALAREEASLLLEADPELEAPENGPVAAQVTRFLDRVSGELS